MQYNVAPGLYFPVRDHGVFELQGGYGAGFYEGTDFNFNISKIIVQPTLGFVNNSAEIGFTLRYVHEIPENIHSAAEYDLSSEDYLEPSGIIRIGGDRLKITGQAGLSLELDFMKRYFYYYDEKIHNYPFMMFLGIEYRYPDAG